MIDWESLSCPRFRVARGVHDLAPFVEFYGTVLNLPVLYRFEDHEGFSGVVFGLPTEAVQLELVRDTNTDQTNTEQTNTVDADNELVMYLADGKMVRELHTRLVAAGHPQVVNRNPYWARREALSFIDPGGWTLILQPL